MEDVSLLQLLAGTAGALGIATVSYRLKFLGKGGATAQGILGTILLGVGGWQWTVPMLVFFLTASSLSKFADRNRKDIVLEGRGSTRDAIQVFSNGGIAGGLVLLGVCLHDARMYLPFLGAVAAAAADTIATEIGTVYGSRPRLITSLKPAPSGTSGAVTGMGLLGAFGGAAMVSVAGLPWVPGKEFVAVLPSVAGGMAGSLVDSILGASAQGRFQCNGCGKLTEQVTHCGQPARLVAGSRFLTNDVVNILCTAVGAICAALLSSS
ncbi:MAG: DUF92 domain-containing protein [Bacteroidota bacterium]